MFRICVPKHWWKNRKLGRIQRKASCNAANNLITSVRIDQIRVLNTRLLPSSSIGNSTNVSTSSRTRTTKRSRTFPKRMCPPLHHSANPLSQLFQIRFHKSLKPFGKVTILMTTTKQHHIVHVPLCQKKKYTQSQYWAHFRLERIRVNMAWMHAIACLISLCLAKQNRQRIVLPIEMRQTDVCHILRSAHQIPRQQHEQKIEH